MAERCLKRTEKTRSRPLRSVIPTASDAARTDHPCSQTRWTTWTTRFKEQRPGTSHLTLQRSHRGSPTVTELSACFLKLKVAGSIPVARSKLDASPVSLRFSAIYRATRSRSPMQPESARQEDSHLSARHRFIGTEIAVSAAPGDS